MAGNRNNADMFKAEIIVPDPGDTGTIDPLVEGMHNICRIVSGGVETRTLGDPTRDGQEMMLNFETDGGTVTVTASTAVDEVGNTVMTFDNVGEFVLFKAIRVTSTTFAWRVVSYDGVGGLSLIGSDNIIEDGAGLLIGSTTQETTSYDGATNVVPELQVLGTAAADSSMMLAAFSETATIAAAPVLHLVKSGDAAIDGTHTIVTDGEVLGAVQAHGDDGTDLEAIAAEVRFEVDGTPATGDMPGRIILATTAEGAETVTTRAQVTKEGIVISAGSSFIHHRNRCVFFEDFFLNAGATETHRSGIAMVLDLDGAQPPTSDYNADAANGEYNLTTASTEQRQGIVIKPMGDQLLIDLTKNPIFECRLKWNFPGATPTADERVAFGFVITLAAAEDTLDNIDHSVMFKMEGTSLNILVEADDASTDTDDQDSTINYADNVYQTFRFDLSTLTDIKFYVDGVEQGGSAVSAGSLTGKVQPFICIQRDAGTEVNVVTIDYVYCEWDRA